MTPHPSTLAWKIPWTEEPGRLQSMGSRRVDMTERLHFHFHFHALEKEMATHSSVLVWRIPGTGEPGGLPSMGSHRVGHDWSDLAAAATAMESYWIAQGAQISVLGWSGRAGWREERVKGEGLYVYIWLIHLVLQQKLTHCKAIILQF